MGMNKFDEIKYYFSKKKKSNRKKEKFVIQWCELRPPLS